MNGFDLGDGFKRASFGGSRDLDGRAAGEAIGLASMADHLLASEDGTLTDSASMLFKSSDFIGKHWTAFDAIGTTEIRRNTGGWKFTITPTTAHTGIMSKHE